MLTSHVEIAEETSTSVMEATPRIEMAEEASTSVMEATELRGSTVTFYGWKYKHYFVVVEEKKKNLKARCTLCAPSKSYYLLHTIPHLILKNIYRQCTKLQN